MPLDATWGWVRTDARRLTSWLGRPRLDGTPCVPGCIVDLSAEHSRHYPQRPDPASRRRSRRSGYRAAGAGHESVRDVHVALVRALGYRSDVRAPDNYVWCSDVPLDMSDEHEWDGCVVVEEGSGRDGTKTPTDGLES